MTGGADRVIVGGWLPGNMNSVRRFSWYDLIGKGLGNSGLHEQAIETPDGSVKRYSRPEDVTIPAGATSAPATAASIELPPWLLAPAPRAAAGDALLRPSDPAENEGHRTRTAHSLQTPARALQRCTLVHRLLQSPPDVALARPRDAALDYLPRNADVCTAGDRRALAYG